MVVSNDKRFDEELAKECDPKAKLASLQVCRRFGMTNFRNNPEGKYKGHIYDLIAEYRGRDVRIETELKKEWTRAWSVAQCHPDVPYKWPTMDVPYRKRDKGIVHADIHDIVGVYQDRLFRIPRRVVLQAPVGEKWVRNRQCLEPFFRVPLPAPCSAFWQKIDGEWVLIRKWDREGNLTFKDGVRLT